MKISGKIIRDDNGRCFVDHFIKGVNGVASRTIRLDCKEMGWPSSEEIFRAQVGPILIGQDMCLYKDYLLHPVDNSAGSLREEDILRIKHFVFSREKELKKIQKEVEAFENFDKTQEAKREHIPDRVRLFVWQRDEGKCVKCGKKEKLEFDHVIPVIEGGSNTERNIQLLCENCNRIKGKNI